MACYFFRFTLLIPFFSLLLVCLSEEFEKYFSKERGQKRLMLVPQRSLMEIHQDADRQYRLLEQTVQFLFRMRLCRNKGSLMVFSSFGSYKSCHKKGTLDFKQRMVKELSELLLTINHSFSTLMQTIHKQLYERTKIIAVIDATAKGFLFPTNNKQQQLQKLRLQLR